MGIREGVHRPSYSFYLCCLPCFYARLIALPSLRQAYPLPYSYYFNFLFFFFCTSSSSSPLRRFFTFLLLSKINSKRYDIFGLITYLYYALRISYSLHFPLLWIFLSRSLFLLFMVISVNIMIISLWHGVVYMCSGYGREDMRWSSYYFKSKFNFILSINHAFMRLKIIRGWCLALVLFFSF